MFTAKNNNLASVAGQAKILKVLIADDDITNRLVLQGILNKSGYYCLHAENGAEAVELFQKEAPDLILMDVMMPIMDGYQATVQIKSLCQDHFVPVIFLTAMTDQSALVRCVQSGGDDFLTKPYNHVILRVRIQALLRIRELYTTIRQQKQEISQHQEHMQLEARMAETLFSNIVKSSDLEAPYIQYLLNPMSLFNGDMLVAAIKPSGGLHVLLGDFTGHGMAAATGALPVATIFYEMTRKGYSVEEVVTAINKKASRILPTGMFLAACLLEFDPASHTLTAWSGGLPDVLIYVAEGGGIKNRIKSTHLPLGILTEDEFDARVDIIPMQNGDRVYMYSDGITETQNLDKQMFGQERLESVLANSSNPSLMFSELKSALAWFRQDSAQNDDVTLVEVTFDSAALDNNLKLVKLTDKASYPPGTWEFSLGLQADVLRCADPLPVVIQAITEVQGLNNRRQQLYTILAELYSNALEHGLLGLDSSLKVTPEGFGLYYQQRQQRLGELQHGFIKIEARHQPTENGGRLSLRLEDSGPGFDFTEKSQRSLVANTGHSGRGVPLVTTLCDSVRYSGCGNIVEAVYVW